MPAGTAGVRAGAGRLADAAEVWATVGGGVLGGDVAVWATGSVALPAFDFVAAGLATGGLDRASTVFGEVGATEGRSVNPPVLLVLRAGLPVGTGCGTTTLAGSSLEVEAPGLKNITSASFEAIAVFAGAGWAAPAWTGDGEAGEDLVGAFVADGVVTVPWGESAGAL